MRFCLAALFVLVTEPLPHAWAAPIADTPFVQEYAEKHHPGKGKAENDVRAIAVRADGAVVAATKAGLHVFQGGAWSLASGGPAGPTFCLYTAADGTLWVGAWDGVYRFEGGKLAKDEGFVPRPVSSFGVLKGELVALGPDGVSAKSGTGWVDRKMPWADSARDTAVAGDGTLYVATRTGLYLETVAGTRAVTKNEDILSSYIEAVETAKDGRVWVGGQGGIDIFEAGHRMTHYGTEDGLPNYHVQSLAFDADGRLWAGTKLGVVRFDGTTWSLRHTRRWLPGDDVRGVVFDAEGTAWVATDKGVGAIKRRMMTLAEKAEHYEMILRARHVRPPGLVEKCYLPDPEDFSQWKPVDDDNDGSYTAMYMAAECLRYAVTKDPEAKKFADEAWKAVDFLHEVPGGTGFVARTVVPIDWKEMADMNRKWMDEEVAEERVDNPRFKKVEERWRKSADGKWYWKGDTSSDEIVGHFFAFNMYYHLAADDTQKARVRVLCKRLMDYLIAGDYTLIDPVTGSHTLWAMWNPERLNHDPDWRTDAPVNCTEMLSFLLLTWKLTGEQRYKDEFDRLFTEYKFGERLTRPKSYGLTERTHIDDDLLSMVWPTFVLNDMEPATQVLWKQGAAWTYTTIEHDVNPMFNFIYAWAGVAETHNEESVDFLRDTPLDLRQFAVDSSQREDLRLQRKPILEEMQTDRILPPSERGTMRWDKNPWAVLSGDFGDAEGHREASGTYWLLPYWMGRYLNIIGPPQRP